jgi:hypothetical protein
MTITAYAQLKLDEMRIIVDSWDEEKRRSFVNDIRTNTPKSNAQIILAKHGITVRDLRRWVNKHWPNVKAH